MERNFQAINPEEMTVEKFRSWRRICGRDGLSTGYLDAIR
jgi:hypothetical protein